MTWTISETNTFSGEPVRIFGGCGDAVGARPTGAPLGSPYGRSQYIVAVGEIGALTVEDFGPESAEIQFNQSRELRLDIVGSERVRIDVVSIDEVAVSNGSRTLRVPLLRDMMRLTPVVTTVAVMVQEAPTLHGAWHDGPMELLLAAGFPAAARNNLDNTVGSSPDGWQQLEDLLRSADFRELAELDAPESADWLTCFFCKLNLALLVVCVVALVAMLLLAIAGPVVGSVLVAASAALAESAAVKELAEATGLDARRVSVICLTSGGTPSGDSLLHDILQALCVELGHCR